MTSSLIRGRPRSARSHISVRVAHAVLGGVAGVAWLVLPGTTINTDVPVAISSHAPGVGTTAAAPKDEDTSAVDLVVPLVAAGAVGALAGYGYVRRTRRARTRTTPGTSGDRGGSHRAPPAPPLTDLDQQSRALLAEADDWVRTSREELGFAEARFGSEAVAPFARAVRDAETELSAAFRIRRRYDDGLGADEASRRHVLAGIVGRCQEAGRRLDAEAAGFDRLRALEGEFEEALAFAETRFRQLVSRTGTTEVTLRDLAERYPPSAATPVTGYVEQAKDRLVFATTRLNQARQADDWADPGRAVHHLRAAEGAVAQAAVLVAAVDRLADELSTAQALVPAALTGAEAALAEARRRPTAGAATPIAGRAPNLPPGESHARVRHADAVLASVREGVTGGPYDPLDALRRIVAATEPLGPGRPGVLSAAGLLAARSTVALADGFVETHRGAVGSTARLLLAEARRTLATEPTAPSRPAEPPDHLEADGLARQARELAEQDVRTHGNPVAGAAGHASGVAGAVLGGILLGGAPDGGPPPTFGGPRTRARRAFPS
ncbi:hypothetical protein OG604_29800 [Streptomyces sp. NBC_01231]|nr:hypothetical protein OG604_29800 [Streptomyces sp. NBC_01231]